MLICTGMLTLSLLAIQRLTRKSWVIHKNVGLDDFFLFAHQTILKHHYLRKIPKDIENKKGDLYKITPSLTPRI